MQTSTIVAALLAPLLVPVYRWVFLTPGRKVHDWLWVNLPDGKLRSVLLRRIK